MRWLVDDGRRGGTFSFLRGPPGTACETPTSSQIRIINVSTAALRAFTLLELVLVLSIIGVVFAVVGLRVGSIGFLDDEAFIRRLTSTIEFVHHQAVVDQSYYRMEFDFKENKFRVGAVRPDDPNSTLAPRDPSLLQAGVLTLELNYFLSPSVGRSQTLIPPPSYPSLFTYTKMDGDASIQDVRTMRGKHTPESGDEAYILFSPRGFSEFAVIHLRTRSQNPVTILINPFTGLTEVFRDYREFEWTYRQQGSS